ncbi:class I SAM-dependent RNA methyltransferase [Acidobacteriota bacterium]
MAKPRCPYFGKCGGCSSQEIDYSHQLELKKENLAREIRYDDIQIFAGDEYGYRHRMDMIFHPGGLGFREKGSWHRAVDVERCVISNESLNSLIEEIREFFKGIEPFNPKQHCGTFRYAVIRTPPSESSVSIVLNKEAGNLDETRKMISQFAEKTSAKNVLITYVIPHRDVSVSEDYEVIKGTEMIKEEYLGGTFWYHIQGFFQNNHNMTEKMHAYCHSLLKTYPTEKAHLLDLYGGVGTFGIINSELFKEISTVESYEPAIEACKRNMDDNKIANVKPILLDAKRLKTLEFPQPLYVITDPPRSGMHPKAIKRLGALQPEIILYVSCNIKLLGRELQELDDYSIKSAALFDLFPHTPHLEAVIELVKKT